MLPSGKQPYVSMATKIHHKSLNNRVVANETEESSKRGPPIIIHEADLRSSEESKSSDSQDSKVIPEEDHEDSENDYNVEFLKQKVSSQLNKLKRIESEQVYAVKKFKNKGFRLKAQAAD